MIGIKINSSTGSKHTLRREKGETCTHLVLCRNLVHYFAHGDIHRITLPDEEHTI